MLKCWECLWVLYTQVNRTQFTRGTRGQWIIQLNGYFAQGASVERQWKQTDLTLWQSTLGTWAGLVQTEAPAPTSTGLTSVFQKLHPSPSSPGFLQNGNSGHYSHESKSLPFFQAPLQRSTQKLTTPHAADRREVPSAPARTPRRSTARLTVTELRSD